MWAEIAENWIECMEHGERFELPGVCTACIQEQEIDAVECDENVVQEEVYRDSRA